MRYNKFDDAFIQELSELLKSGSAVPAIIDPSSPASHFGQQPREALELLGTSFTVANPELPLISGQHLPINLSLVVGLTLWTLSGSNDNDWLLYYDANASPRRNPAWGDRLFGNRGIDQVERAIELLESDPATRRAFLPILGVEHTANPSGGVPCAAGIQFFIRDEAVHCVAIMRAQNALTSMALDVFVFSHLLFYVADRMNLGIGSYTHMCSTFHIFADQRSEVDRILSVPDSISVCSLGRSSGFSTELPALLAFEVEVRKLVESGRFHLSADLDSKITEVRDFSAPLSRGFATVLLATAMHRSGVGRADIENSLPGFGALVANATFTLGPA